MFIGKGQINTSIDLPGLVGVSESNFVQVIL